VAALTHSHDDVRVATIAAVEFASRCIQVGEMGHVLASLRHGVGPFAREFVAVAGEAVRAGQTEPCVPDVLAQVAPDRTAAAAVAGAVYVVASFPEVDSVADALEFAGWAPDGDSVAAAAGAFLGALHGYEALPVGLLDRLEIGWVMDRLARDLAVQVQRDQSGGGWQGREQSEPRDPWWSTKYPRV
jgi:ADP-ribosylglycohydrolase